MIGPFNYRLFGLLLRSELELPELTRTDTDDVPDVILSVERPLAEPLTAGVHAMPDGAQLVIDGVADYTIEAGNRITVRPQPGAPEANVRLFLLGSAMGMLLHQRGLLPLHANAIEIEGEAVAFAGESGAGKSTLAAWCHDRGARIIADDICVIGFSDDGRALAMPGMPRFRLWREALERSGRESGHHPRSYSGDEDYEKFDVAAEQKLIVRTPIRLRAIYLLERGEVSQIESMAGIDAAEALFAHTYRGAYAQIVGAQESHWRTCLRVLQTVPVYRAKRRWNLGEMDSENEALLAGLSSAPAADRTRR
ncbi:MAG: hypothetical protein ABR588_01960 [Sphingomicrobium sp.]|nr:hypothetical protein [Sphingomonadales bacterium]